MVQSNGNQTKSARTRSRGKLRILTIVLTAALCCLIGVAVWLSWPHLMGSEPAAELELPSQIQIKNVILADCVRLEPDDFVSGLENLGITVSFEGFPADTVGEQVVTLKFSDGTSVCTRQATLQIFHLEQKVVGVVGEAEGEFAYPGIRDFVPDETMEAQFVGKTPEDVPLDRCGETTLRISCAGREYEVIYSLEERVAPEGTPVRVETETGVLPNPETLVKDIVDQSAVTVTYQQIPDLSVVGSVEVTLVLTDIYGNKATVASVIDVVPAADAPRFEGLEDLHIRVGNTISYKTNVKAVDAQDGEVSFSVNAVGVDQNTEGTYTVYYSATDSHGNTTIVPRKVIVGSVDSAEVEKYAREVLDKIIRPDMTRDQKIRTVYIYTQRNVLYVGKGDKSSIVHAAYEGFSTGKGDCYTYYAMNVILFNMLGIEHLEVTRIGGTSHHWWNLVLFEDGKYYHVDSTPVAVKVEGVSHGKMTDSDLQIYTADPTVAGRRPNFYVYDKTLPEYEGIEIAS